MKIKKITHFASKEHTWDIESPEVHNYLIEDGLVTHNSSVIQNSTNGIEPVRSLMSYKKAKNGILKQIVPNYMSRKNYYTLAWEMQNNNAIINISAVLQKFVDMGISTNLYYNYSHYPEGNIPLSILIKDQLYGYKYGIKNFYYCNTPDSDGNTEKDMLSETCSGGSCAI